MKFKNLRGVFGLFIEWPVHWMSSYCSCLTCWHGEGKSYVYKLSGSQLWAHTEIILEIYTVPYPRLYPQLINLSCFNPNFIRIYLMPLVIIIQSVSWKAPDHRHHVSEKPGVLLTDTLVWILESAGPFVCSSEGLSPLSPIPLISWTLSPFSGWSWL